MSETYKLLGLDEALDVFKKIALSNEDERKITQNARAIIKNQIKQPHYWNDRTGELSKSNFTRILDNFKIKFGFSAPHAIYLAKGTGIYGAKKKPITPKNAKALSWVSGGRRVFAKSVRGIKGREWLEADLALAMPEIEKSITASTKRAMRK